MPPTCSTLSSWRAEARSARVQKGKLLKLQSSEDKLQVEAAALRLRVETDLGRGALEALLRRLGGSASVRPA